MLDLFEKQRDAVIIEKNELSDELEKVRDVLEETVKVNSSKISKELKIREAESIEIRKGQTGLLKCEKDLAESRRKLEKNEEMIRKYHLEVDQLGREKERGEEENRALNLEVTDLIKREEALINERDQLTTLHLGLKNTQDMLLDELERYKGLYLETQEEYEYVRARLAYMQENIHLDRIVKEFHIEELRGLIDHNKDMTSSVGELLKQWDSIKQFGKS